MTPVLVAPAESAPPFNDCCMCSKYSLNMSTLAVNGVAHGELSTRCMNLCVLWEDSTLRLVIAIAGAAAAACAAGAATAFRFHQLFVFGDAQTFAIDHTRAFWTRPKQIMKVQVCNRSMRTGNDTRDRASCRGIFCLEVCKSEIRCRAERRSGAVP